MRGQKLSGVSPADLWELLDGETYRVLHDGAVNSEYLNPQAVVYEAEVEDLLVFNPCYVHLGVTTSAPRYSENMFAFDPNNPS